MSIIPSIIPCINETHTKKVTISDDLRGAENGTRTRDLNLGKVALYQLSYFRKVSLIRSNPYEWTAKLVKFYLVEPV